MSAELRSTVGDALDELPVDEREVVELAYMGGLSQREISERTGLPLGTIKPAPGSPSGSSAGCSIPPGEAG